MAAAVAVALPFPFPVPFPVPARRSVSSVLVFVLPALPVSTVSTVPVFVVVVSDQCTVFQANNLTPLIN